MELAILGTDPDIISLAAAAQSLGHEVVWLGDVRPADAHAIRELAGGADSSTDWETLLDRATADAVVIGRGTVGNELRAEQLKRLATDGVPMLVVHPACDSVLTYYEIDMIRRETGCIIRHYNPLAAAPSLAELADWVRDGHPNVGAVHQVSCERRLGDVRREAVIRALARDAELLALVDGAIHRVSAAGPRAADASFASLQVQFSAAERPSLRWSVAPSSGDGPGVVLTLVCERGTILLRATDAPQKSAAMECAIDIKPSGLSEGIELFPFDAPATAVEALAAAIAETDVTRRGAHSTWSKATQAMEVVEAVELSLEKGRTMEVHQQQLTEQLAFRGTMAALGCGLLLVGFVVLALAALLGIFEAPNERQQLFPNWAVVLLAVLAFFLSLQAIPLLVSKGKRADQANGAESDSPEDRRSH